MLGTGEEPEGVSIIHLTTVMIGCEYLTDVAPWRSQGNEAKKQTGDPKKRLEE